jgi:myo-inositol catabolism protein IolC
VLRELCRAAAETSKRVEGYYVGKTDMADYYEALAINLKYAEPEADIAGQFKWLEDSWGDEIAEQEEAEKTHERA